jgi:hypothetical protein
MDRYQLTISGDKPSKMAAHSWNIDRYHLATSSGDRTDKMAAHSWNIDRYQLTATL